MKYNNIKNRTLWKKIAEVSCRMNIPVYVVGGAVRDLIVGAESVDSDFLVLGPAESFAIKARQYLSGSKVVYFPKFKSGRKEIFN